MPRKQQRRLQVSQIYENEQRLINVEKATFCSLVFLCTGGVDSSASKELKQLASKLATEKEVSYADLSYTNK